MIDGAKHILVVDDDEDARDAVVAMLDGRGYRVSVARGGAAMRNLLAGDSTIDAVVLDASMRQSNNASLRLYAEGLKLPVVLVSGSREAMAFAAAHGLSLLEKPFRVQQLVDALDSAIAGNHPPPGNNPGPIDRASGAAK